MRILFIGGTGNISSAVSKLAVKKGYELYLLNRGKRKSFVPEGAKVIIGDINDEEQLKKSLDGLTFDCIVDWIAFEPKDIERDLRIFRGITSQYIFISSASCYQRPPKNYIVTENTPLENPYWEYARLKIQCEDVLWNEYEKNGFPVTVVRPSYTYGKTFVPFIFTSRKSRWTLVDRMLKGKKIIVPGDGTSLFALTYNEDFAKGFVGLLGNKKAIGEAYHITSDEVLTWDQIANAIGEAVGVNPDIIHLTSEYISVFNPEARGGLFGDKAASVVFDNSKIRTIVPDFKASIPFSEGVKECIKYYRLNPELLEIDDEFNAICDKMINAYEKSIG